jgi:hypothetical protein
VSEGSINPEQKAHECVAVDEVKLTMIDGSLFIESDQLVVVVLYYKLFII